MFRPACPGEKVYIHAPEMVQLAMKLVSPRDVPHILDGVINATSGLRLKVSGDSLVSHHSPFDVIRLPNSITNTEEACNYIYLNHTPTFTKTLATVAANDHIVALNSHHLCADGGFLRYIYEHCADSEFSKRRAPKLPRALTDIWQTEVRNAEHELPYDGPERLTRLNLKQKPRDRVGDEKADFAQWCCPVSSLTVYNPRTGKCDGLTERLWTALSLAGHAYNGRLTNDFGVVTCVDLRHLMRPQEVGIDVCNNFLGVIIAASGVTQKSTIKELGEAMRRNFALKTKNRALFRLPPAGAEQQGSCIVGLSNMGPLVVKPPFEDVCGCNRRWIQTSQMGRSAF
jgi:hypothetical protein